jgi:hypothetical protein
MLKKLLSPYTCYMKKKKNAEQEATTNGQNNEINKQWLL